MVLAEKERGDLDKTLKDLKLSTDVRSAAPHLIEDSKTLEMDDMCDAHSGFCLCRR